MFKFMKSKKDLSLVELMIVVVIMAILVAVAVPIFNSVTGSSRAKTCIDNQRSLVSTINTDILDKNLVADETIKVTYNGTDAAYVTDGNTVYDDAHLKEIFKTVPYCPAGDAKTTSTITVIIDVPLGQDTHKITDISTSCSVVDAKNPHVVQQD